MFRRSIWVLVASALLFAPGTARADTQWLRAETAHFVLYSDADQRTTQSEADALERFDAGLRQLTGTPDDQDHNKLDIYYLQSREDFSRFWPQASSGVQGLYSANVLNIADYVNGAGGYRTSGQQVLFHEYAHHFMYQYFPGLYPTCSSKASRSLWKRRPSKMASPNSATSTPAADLG